jgi:serine/threonine protein kinase/Tol biopolymer transport system component
MPLTIGTRLGPYEVVAAIGAGGMGEIYRAKDTRLNRDVAIKVLPTSFSGEADRRARFEREAQAVAALSHPNVIAIFDTGLHEQQIYVVMELLEGETLRERLRPQRGAERAAFGGAQAAPSESRGAEAERVGVGPHSQLNDADALPVRKAIEISVQIARGLAAAHDKGLVHRDLKPENVFLLHDGQVKILDFGLARAAVGPNAGSGATETVAAMTDPGTVMGTVGYMAPEQVRGRPVDARTDLFAFGAVLYEMLSGQRAFQRETAAETMTAILKEDPPELAVLRPEIAPALERIVRHCLEKNPAERFQSARDVAFALEALSGSASATVVSGAVAIDISGPVRRPRGSLVMAAAVAGALVLGATAGYFGRGRPANTSAGVADITYKPVTFEDGFVFTARFAPDGRTVVYSADWDRQPRGVYVTSLDSLEYRPLGFPGADLLGISRSGDLVILNGSRISGGSAYIRIGTLAKASLTGGAQRAELEGVRFADLGPDNSLAVVREEGGRRTMEYPVGHVLQEEQILNSRGATDFVTPRISPSGNHVAFFDNREASGFRVKVFDRSGKLVTESRPFADWWSLAWTPSNEIWFAAAEASGSQTAIFSLDLSGHQRMVFRAPGSITLHDISNDGDVLVTFDRGTARVELIEGSDEAPRDRSWREADRLAGFSSNHALLINGTGDSGGPQGAVYVWQPKEPQPVRIANGLGLALAPDGSKALVTSNQSPTKISIVPTGAGQPHAIDIGPVELVTWASWLPDGRLVMQIVRPGTGPAVYVVSATGRDPAPLLPSGTTLRGFNLISPNGASIVAVDAAGRFVVCPIASPTCRPLPGARDGDVVSGWSADGQSVFVFQPQPMQAQIERIDVGSGRRSAWKTVRSLNPAVTGFSTLMVAPDGAVGYGYGRSRSELYVIKGLK